MKSIITSINNGEHGFVINNPVFLPLHSKRLDWKGEINEKPFELKKRKTVPESFALKTLNL